MSECFAFLLELLLEAWREVGLAELVEEEAEVVFVVAG